MTTNRDRIPPRPLTARERDLLLFLLSVPFPRRDDLLRQAETVLVCGECACGCTTIDLLVPERPEGWTSPLMPVAAEAHNFSDPATPVEVLLHTTNDTLRELEIVWFTDTRPIERIAPGALTLGPPKSRSGSPSPRQ